ARAWMPRGFWRVSSWLRWVPALFVHGALAGLPALLWYGVRNPAVLRAHPCSVFLTSVVDSPWTVLADVETQRALRDLVANASGALLGLGVSGLIALLVVARLRALVLIASTACVLVLSASLGWHMRAHEYDGLYLVPLSALSIGAALALFGEGARRLGRLGTFAMIGAATVSSGMWVVDGIVDRGRLTHSGFLLEAGHDLNQVLDPTEGVHESVWENPLLSYFAARRSRVLAHHFPEEKCETIEFDCAAALREEPVASCFLSRATSHVYFPGVEAHCGLLDPGGARGRLLAHVQEHSTRVFEPPLRLADGSVVVAADSWMLRGVSGAIAPGRHVDLYVEGRTGGSITVFVGGDKLEAKPPEGVRSLGGYTLVDYRVVLPGRGDVELHLPGGGPAIIVPTRLDAPAAWDCATGPRANAPVTHAR
ncbi:MAG TPA: hypothetical protein VIF09_07920, partial [Polyangiaceae bacterium]